MKASKEPAYMQIRGYLLSEIASGRFGPDDRLPSESELAKRFGVTRSTVVHGLSSLVSEGRITRVAGKGTFVARKAIRATQNSSLVRSFDEEMVEHGAKIEFRLLNFGLVNATTTVCGQLDMNDDSEVFRLERIRFVDNVPTVHEVRFIPVSLGRQLTIDALSRFPMFAILSEIGSAVAHIQGVIHVDAASYDVATKLSIDVGAPILVREFVLMGAASNPLVVGSAVFTREVQFSYAANAPESQNGTDTGA